MFKRIVATLVSLAISVLPMTAAAGAQPKVKKWDPATKSKKVKAQRYTAPNGSKILVAPDGKRYLLDDAGRHYMVDPAGNKVQVNKAGKIIDTSAQKDLKRRIGPGPLA